MTQYYKTKLKVKEAFSNLIFFSLISIFPFIIYFKLYPIWIIFLLGFFILSLGFLTFFRNLIEILYFKFPSFFLFRYSKDPELDFSFLLTSFIALIFFLLTNSIIIAFIFILLFSLGFLYVKLQKNISICFSLMILSIITFLYALEYRNLLIYIISTHLIILASFGFDEYIGKNLGKKASIPFFNNSIIIILISIIIFSSNFYNIEILFIIGILGLLFFGTIALRLIIESILWNRLIFTDKDADNSLNLSMGIVSLILFGIFIFSERNILIFIVASTFLFFGGFGSRLFLKKYFSDNLTKNIANNICSILLGIILILFYYLFFKNFLIIYIGIALVFSSLIIIQRKIKYGERKTIN